MGVFHSTLVPRIVCKHKFSRKKKKITSFLTAILFYLTNYVLFGIEWHMNYQKIGRIS